MKSATLFAAAGLFLGLVGAGQAVAAEPGRPGSSPWYIHTGPLVVKYDESAKISVGGGQIPGARVKADSNYSVGIEAGYKFTKNWAVSLTVGAPPNAILVGTGPLEGVKLGKVMYGPAVLSGHYHFTNFGPKFEPYVGAGVNYTIVLRDKDAAVQNLKVKSPVGLVLQAGVESQINDRIGVFVDAKQIFLDTDATGTVGGAPASAEIQLNPLIVMAGVSVHF
ncbi:OmpW family outer membrane protein [Caulobacter sp. SSI4214]|uniref:OmpW/AlkL family protein n=1 Tax=Caulobacter sp. SSI4214 TaxID=2575739 RepID=UPI00143A607F|nr:OmpW family outer membrane protein [Caulobacter sp. SSI4214]